MAYFSTSNLGNALQTLLMADDIEPGDPPSYQTCKAIYTYHPLGAKMAESPISIAQSQKRTITIQNGPEDRCREAFLREWEEVSADKHIFNTMRLARVYGISSVAMLAEGVPPSRPIDYKALKSLKLGFNVVDPLNTAGSLVLNQNPNALDFQKVHGISISGIPYHPSRSVTMMNEDPLYIDYTVSGFGYVGRSVYQRALYPLKSFIQTMVTDDLVSLKAGVIVAKQKMPGSVVNNAMRSILGLKRSIVQEARTGNVISIGLDEFIESIDLKNLDGPVAMARRNIIENIATSAPMPAKLLLQESFAEGFGEGTEDAKYVAGFVDGVRVQMLPLYNFFDKICQYRAWNPEFYKTIQRDFPHMANVGYTQAFYNWTNSFAAVWPSLLTEPDSEKIKVDDVKLRAIIALLEVLLPALDPENKVRIIEWACDNFNELKLLFGTKLEIDYDALEDYEPPQVTGLGGEDGDDEKEPEAPRPFAKDSQETRGMRNFKDAVASLDKLKRNMIAVPPRRGQSAASYMAQNGIPARGR